MSKTRLGADLLEMLLPHGIEESPLIPAPRGQFDKNLAFLYRALAQAYHRSGRPQLAISLYRKALQFTEPPAERADCRDKLADALRLSGELKAAEDELRLALGEPDLKRETRASARGHLSTIFAVRGVLAESERCTSEALDLCVDQLPHTEGWLRACIAQRLIWSGQYAEAAKEAGTAQKLAGVEGFGRDLPRALRLLGTAELYRRKVVRARLCLQDALRLSDHEERVVADEPLVAGAELAELRAIIAQEDGSNGPANSEGTWKEWRQAVVNRKKGNLDAIVMFGLISGTPQPLVALPRLAGGATSRAADRTR